MRNIRFILQSDRIEIPILDPEAAITFWLCVLKKNRKLLDVIPTPC